MIKEIGVTVAVAAALCVVWGHQIVKAAIEAWKGRK